MFSDSVLHRPTARLVQWVLNWNLWSVSHVKILITLLLSLYRHTVSSFSCVTVGYSAAWNLLILFPICPAGPTSPAYSPTSPVSVVTFVHVCIAPSHASKLARTLLSTNNRRTVSNLSYLHSYFKENALTSIILLSPGPTSPAYSPTSPVSSRFLLREKNAMLRIPHSKLFAPFAALLPQAYSQYLIAIPALRQTWTKSNSILFYTLFSRSYISGLQSNLTGELHSFDDTCPWCLSMDSNIPWWLSSLFTGIFAYKSCETIIFFPAVRTIIDFSCSLEFCFSLRLQRLTHPQAPWVLMSIYLFHNLLHWFSNFSMLVVYMLRSKAYSPTSPVSRLLLSLMCPQRFVTPSNIFTFLLQCRHTVSTIFERSNLVHRHNFRQLTSLVCDSLLRSHLACVFAYKPGLLAHKSSEYITFYAY